MADQIRLQRAGGNDEDNEHMPSLTPNKGQIQEYGLDDILDEIETVLESNAEEMVHSYVQQGGQ